MKPTGANPVVKHATSAHRLSTVAGKALCVLYTSPVACLRNLLQLVSHLNEVFSFRFAAESSAIRQLDWMTDQTGHTPTANFRFARDPSTIRKFGSKLGKSSRQCEDLFLAELAV
jgi:hypothetical protein